MAVPFAETLPAGRASLWQFALYEARSAEKWRSLNRLDLGLAEGLELGVLLISPHDRPSDTWINLQYRPFKETLYRPVLSVGVWDMGRKAGPWFSDKKTGASPFLSLGKTLQRGDQFLKLGLSYGSNRLQGLFGGGDLRFLRHTGIQVEYAPENLRLPGTEAWDVGLYRWIGKHWRARVSRMGGNPMLDVFFTYDLSAK